MYSVPWASLWDLCFGDWDQDTTVDCCLLKTFIGYYEDGDTKKSGEWCESVL